MITLPPLASPVALSVQNPEIKAVRLLKPPVIDGVISPGEWDSAAKSGPFIDSNVGAPTGDPTEVWVGYDNVAIYVAFYCHDRKPQELVGREIQAGSEFHGEDSVTFRVNPYGNKRWDGSSRFTVNLLNTQSESIAGGRSSKREWRGIWQSAVKRNADGYTVEMRIPWRVLNYPTGPKRNMDLDFERYQARTSISSNWPNIGIDQLPERRATWLDVEPPAAVEGKKLQLLAYAAPEIERGQFQLRKGLDARYAITRQLSGLVSVGPDFRNIEQQIAGVQFSHTERFLDEARPFFTEGGDFFSLNGDYGFGRMFYSRRIGNFDLGGKSYGQITPTLSVGALATEAFGNETDTVMRLGKSFGTYSGASIFSTSYSKNGVQNSAGGGSVYERSGNYQFDSNIAYDADRGKKIDTAGDASIIYQVPHWFSLTRAEWIQPDFAPPLGYIPWTDKHGYYNYSEYHNEYRKGPIKDVFLSFDHEDFATYESGPQQKGISASIGAKTRQDTQLGLDYTEMGYYGALDKLIGLNAHLNDSNRFNRYGFYVQTGTRAGVDSHYYSVDGSFRILKKIDLGLSEAVQDYKGVDRLTVGTIGYEVSATRSLTGRVVQHNGNTNAYFAYRNGGSTGTETYFILGDPNAERTVPRLSVKVVWAF